MSAAAQPLRESDRDAWAALWSAYLTFYDPTLPDAVYAAIWSRISDPAGTVRALATRDERGTLVGITHYLFHATAWSTQDMCYLQDLFVDPAVRGRGHARALIAAVAAAARARSARALYWQTHRTNAVAQRLYDTVARNEGFIVYTLDLHAEGGPLPA